jgi:Fe-S-cluster containining protein
MSKKKDKKKRPSIPPKALRDIWAKVPNMVDCKGVCHDSCGPIPVSTIERKLLEERAGKKLQPEGAGLTCSLLTPAGTCSVYAIRPLICRIWGAAVGVPCVHGCKSERTLTKDEAAELFREIEELTGEDAGQAVEDMLASMTATQERVWKAQAGPAIERVIAAEGHRPSLSALMGEASDD